MSQGAAQAVETGAEGAEARIAPRINLFLAATVHAGISRAPVRIRNMSATGALLEGSVIPRVGAHISLRRCDIAIGGTVVWSAGARCGVQFDHDTRVEDWIAGTRSAEASLTGQVRVDAAQAAMRSGADSILRAVPPTPPPPPADDPELDRRLAQELAYLGRMIEMMGNELSDEPVVVQRHFKALQNFDIVKQTLDHVARILTAGDRGEAVAAIGMEDLRARLTRKPNFKA